MSNTNQIPREDGIDHSLSLLREGYMYILNRRRSFQSDIFETRLLGSKVICMGGKEAAEVFYDTEKFKRKNAAPNRAVQTLFGKNGVQSLDDMEHKQRKELFMSIMSPDQLKKLINITKEQWQAAVNKWRDIDEVTLYDGVQELLCRTACQWAGVPLPEEKATELSKDLGAMFESAAKVGPSHWKGRNARNQVEKWMGDLIDKVRAGIVQPPKNSVLEQFVWYRNPDGNLLDTKTVAVEIINILRPIVAIAIYVNFLALALHHHPEETKKLKTTDKKYHELFIQEVRRFFPFFPFIAALVKKDFTWKGYTFKKDTLTLLDIYGTNHDTRIWDNPDRFNPKRFENRKENLYDFIPQGGGDYFLGHRCAGEWLTLEVLKVSLDFLINQINYDIPDQDLSFSMVNMPSIPNSRIVIKNVK
ncbi:cytochrome P450 [Cytobacillus praedii]|uniref:cytochrome P450 n=1 Tax=Cytobacillus praedii TaxID=1742358 RepID=UPI002E1B7159|nr:cytochrome P450 [Cytobacillus praedii]MED3575330.1 cytochrome P450 [Cytobacillus praedii]